MTVIWFIVLSVAIISVGSAIILGIVLGVAIYRGRKEDLRRHIAFSSKALALVTPTER